MTAKKRFGKLVLVAATAAFATFVHATGMDHKGRVIAAVQWPMGLLKTPPQVWDAPQYATNGIRAIFYEGLPYKGRILRGTH